MQRCIYHLLEDLLLQAYSTDDMVDDGPTPAEQRSFSSVNFFLPMSLHCNVHILHFLPILIDYTVVLNRKFIKPRIEYFWKKFWVCPRTLSGFGTNTVQPLCLPFSYISHGCVYISWRPKTSFLAPSWSSPLKPLTLRVVLCIFAVLCALFWIVSHSSLSPVRHVSRVEQEPIV